MMKTTILKKLKELGLKCTPQRLAIIDALIENTLLHPGARLIYREARKKTKSLSLYTAYATLDELSRHGIIKMLEFDKMENRYEGNIAAYINLACKRCGKIMDYKAPLSIDLKEVAKKRLLGCRYQIRILRILPEVQKRLSQLFHYALLLPGLGRNM